MALAVLAIALWVISAEAVASAGDAIDPPAPAAAVATPTLTGPAKIRPGKKVVFRARSFAPRKRINVSLSPTRHRGGNCCGVPIKKRFRANRRGREVLRFRVPRTYDYCAGVSNCSKRKWKPRMKVDVFACTAKDGCGLTTVRIKRRR